MAIRTLDELGRVVIPSEIRRDMGWEDGQKFFVETNDDGTITLHPKRTNRQDELLETLQEAKDYVDGGRNPDLEERLGKAIDQLQ